MLDSINAWKLRTALDKIPVRTLKDAVDRINGNGSKVASALRRLEIQLKAKPREAFNKWKHHVVAVKNKQILDGITALKLSKTLLKIPYRTLKDAVDRINGDGSKVAGALRRLDIQLRKKPREAFNKWKNYIKDCENKEILDNNKALKLQKSLEKIPVRTLKDAVDRINGDGSKVAGALRRLEMQLRKKPRQALTNLKDNVNARKNQDALDLNKALNLKNRLMKFPRKSIKDVLDRVIGNGNKLAGALRRLAIQADKKPKEALKLWKTNADACKNKDLLDNVKSEKLKNALEKIPARTLRSAFDSINDTTTPVRQLKRLAQIYQSMPKNALRLWKNFVNNSKCVDLTKQLRAEKLKAEMADIPAKKLREAFERIVRGETNTKRKVNNLVKTAQKKPLRAVGGWKGKTEVDKVLKPLNANKLKAALAKIPLRSLRDSIDRITNQKTPEAALRRLYLIYKNKPRDAIKRWRDYVNQCKTGDLLDRVKAEKLKDCLNRIPTRTLRDGVTRIVGQGDKFAGALNMLANRAQKIPRNALKKLKDYVEATKRGDILDRVKAEQLKNKLENIPRRILRDAHDRILNDGDKVKAAIKKLHRAHQRKPKEAFDKWSDFSNDCKNKKILDSLRTEKLKSALSKVPARTLKDACNRIIGDGNVVAAALRRIQLALNKKPKNAFDKWKNYVGDVKTKNLLDNIKSEKLRNCLAKLPQRTIKQTVERILGDGDVVKGAIRRLDLKLRQKPKQAFDTWKNYINSVKNKDLLDNVRTQKLKNILESIPRRTLKDAHERIIGGGDKVKGVLRRLMLNAMKRPQEAFDRWDDFVKACKNNKLLDQLRTQKLKNSLEKIPRRTLKDAFSELSEDKFKLVKRAIRDLLRKIQAREANALIKWKDYIIQCKNRGLLDNVRSQALKNALNKIPVRTAKDAFERLIGDGDKISGAIRRLEIQLKHKPREAFDKWKNYLKACEKKEILDNNNALRLKASLEKIPHRTLKDAVDRINGDGSKVAGALRRLEIQLKAKPREAFNKWKDYRNAVKNNVILDNNKALKLSKSLEKIPHRTLKDAVDRIVGDGSKVAGALRRLEIQLKAKPREAFNIWKDYRNAVNNKEILDGVNALKLSKTLDRIPHRTLKDALDRIVGDGSKVAGALRRLEIQLKAKPREAFNIWKDYRNAVKNNEILDNNKALKLSKTLDKIPHRTLKDAVDRIVGDGSKVAGALRRLEIHLKAKPREAFNKWKDYRNAVNNNQILDNVKALKLSKTLDKIPHRTLKDALDRVVGDGSKVAGALRRLEIQLKAKPREAFNIWKDYRNAVKNNNILDNNKALKLSKSLDRIPHRTLKDAVDRIVGDGSKVAGALRRLEIQLKAKPREAFNIWKDYRNAVKNNKILDNNKALKLSKTLDRIPHRTLKDAVDRIIGDGSKVAGAIRRLEIQLKAKPREAFNIWKDYRNAVKNNEILDNVKALKLSKSLDRIPHRTLKDAVDRIIGDGSKVAGALRRLEIQLKAKPREAFNIWKDYRNAVKNNEILDNVKALKLSISLDRIPHRTLKDAIDRIVGDGSKVAGAIRRLEIQLKAKPRVAFNIWKDYRNAVNNNQILDNVKALKLSKRLDKIPHRTLKDAVDRIVGDGSKVAGALRRLDMQLKKKPKLALKKLKDHVNDCKNNDALDAAKAQKLRNALSTIPARTLKDGLDRINGDGSKVKAALRRLDIQLRKSPKQAIDAWKDYLNHAKNKDLLDNLTSEKLRNALSKLSARTLKSGFNTITNSTSPARQLKRLAQIYQNMPRNALRLWKDFVNTKDKDDLELQLRAEKLRHEMNDIPAKKLKEAFERIVRGEKNTKKKLNNLVKAGQKKPLRAVRNWEGKTEVDKVLKPYKANKLKAALAKIPLRTLKDTFDRATSQKTPESALRRLYMIHKNAPRDAMNRWKDFLNSCKKGDLLDQMRAQKLRDVMNRIPVRSLRDSTTRLIGQGNKVAGTLAMLDSQAQKVPRNAIKLWRDYVEACKRGELMDQMRAQHLRSALSKIPARAVNDAFTRITYKSDLVKNAIKRFIHRVKNGPKEAYMTWKKFTDNCKTGDLLDAIKTEKLRQALDKIPLRTERDALRRITASNNLVKSSFRRFILFQQLSLTAALHKWRENTLVVKSIDNERGNKLRSVLESIPRRILKNSLLRIAGDGFLIGGALASLNGRLNQSLKDALMKWRVANDMTKHADRYRLVGMLFQRMKDGSSLNQRMAFKIWTNDTTAKMVSALRRMNLMAENGLKRSIGHWHMQVQKIKSAELLKYAPVLQNLIKLREKALRLTLNSTFRTWAFDRNKARRRTVSKIVRNLVGRQKDGVETLRERVLKLRMIKKVNAAYLLMRMLEAKAKIMLNGRFTIWKLDDYMRRMRLLKKYVMIMMFRTSISYEPGFWRWKYVITKHGQELHPKHSIMYDRLHKITIHYQRRLKQFAMFKLILSFKTNNAGGNRASVQLAGLGSLLRASALSRDGRMSVALNNLRESETDWRTPSPDRPLTGLEMTGSIPIISSQSFSRLPNEEVPSRMSKEEMDKISQTGAAEVIGLQLREVRLRNLAIGMTAISTYSRQIGLFEDERGRLIESINELRYDKHSLLDDNTALRHHNEALIESLEVTNLNFQTLSLQLDQMRLGRMVRVISKMIEMPILEALIVLRHNAGILSP